MYLFLLPLAAAVLGWLFNLLFVRYLFGKIIPQQASGLAAAAGRYASEKVLDKDALSRSIADPGKLAALHPVIESHIDVFLNEKLKEKMPAIAMFIGEKTIGMMKKSLMEEIELLLPELLSKYAGDLGSSLDIEKMLVARIKDIPEAQVTATLHRHLGREKRLFQLYGAFAGLIIGMVMALLVLAGR